MSDPRLLALFLLGVCCLAGAFALGIGAFEYEVTSAGAVDGPPEGTQFVTNKSPQGLEDETVVLVAYESLSERDRRIVDRALAGERLVFRRPGDLPGKYESDGRFAVQRDGRTYLVNRRGFFNWRTPFGLASLTLGVVGVAAVSEAVRRRHFPHRTVVWTRPR